MIQINTLSITIGEVNVCNGLSCQIEAGQTWGLLGANGTGKTTLLHTLAGLSKPQTGTVLIDDVELQALSHRQRSRKLGMLFQQENTDFPCTGMEMTLLGRHPHLDFWQWESAHDKQIAWRALRETQLDTLAMRTVNTLSGGEQRRLAFARLMTQSPTWYLLDEPLNHLDVAHQILLLDLVRQQAQARQGAVIMSLHDLNLAARYCDHFILLLGNGHTVHGAKEQVLQTHILSELYQHPIKKIENDQGYAFIPD